MKKERFTHPQVVAFMEQEFDFDHQEKESYEDWLEAFSAAVAKNAKEGKLFTGVSSGYDSGALAYELTKQKIPFRAYTVNMNEHELVLKRRGRFLSDHHIVEYGPWFEGYQKELEGKIENAPYTIQYDGKIREQTILDDNASVALAFMCDTAKKEGFAVYLSTQGADEILADYGLWPTQSTFKGTFPEKLTEWYNFKDGCNYSYLLKETRIPEAYGVEVRFPFLDIDLVQEFLWLTPELKNRNYKAPLYEYLVGNGVPFECSKKRGFTPA